MLTLAVLRYIYILLYYYFMKQNVWAHFNLSLAVKFHTELNDNLKSLTLGHSFWTSLNHRHRNRPRSMYGNKL